MFGGEETLRQMLFAIISITIAESIILAENEQSLFLNDTQREYRGNINHCERGLCTVTHRRWINIIRPRVSSIRKRMKIYAELMGNHKKYWIKSQYDNKFEKTDRSPERGSSSDLRRILHQVLAAERCCGKRGERVPADFGGQRKLPIWVSD